jgi:hypothetical protein
LTSGTSSAISGFAERRGERERCAYKRDCADEADTATGQVRGRQEREQPRDDQRDREREPHRNPLAVRGAPFERFQIVGGDAKFQAAATSAARS